MNLKSIYFEIVVIAETGKGQKHNFKGATENDSN